MKHCRFCGKEGLHGILDLGHQPPSNSFLTKEQLNAPEVYYPLKLWVCDSCWLAQVNEKKRVRDIFTEDYIYYSSESPANVSHAKAYCEMMMRRFPEIKTVLEIGSNDGYMLQWFKKKGCSVKGMDPARGPAKIAESKNIPTEIAMFGTTIVGENGGRIIYPEEKYDLICGINVLNHQSDINDFVKGLKLALAPMGVITFEFPSLMEMVEKGEWDTIYHEHLNYYSLSTIYEIFVRHGLHIFDVDELPEHGGSLRIYASHVIMPASIKCQELVRDEFDSGMRTIAYYNQFARDVGQSRTDIIRSIRRKNDDGAIVVAYGAAAKANTLINYCGFNRDDIAYITDRSPHKIGKYLPGSHIPVKDPEIIQLTKPNYVLITAWNLQKEIMEQLAYIKEWGGKFIIPLPDLKII